MQLRPVFGAIGLLMAILGGLTFFVFAANENWYAGAAELMAASGTTTLAGMLLTWVCLPRPATT